MIELRDIHKTFRVVKRKKGLAAAAKGLFRREYQQVHAVDGVGFTVQAGEMVGFIGPNGAGKSTTIKIMSGILAPDAGECTVLGYTPWKERRAYVGQIGVVFGQRTQLWWDVPVQDSYDLLRDIYDIDSALYKANLAELTETLELDELLHVPLRQLSLGQRMRCEIAASLLHSPKVLFLDEPTIGLDAVSKLAMRRFIGKLNQSRGVTVILTTHDMDDIEALTDRILLIGKGRLLYDGSMESIRRRHDVQRTLRLRFASCETPVEVEGAQLLAWEGEEAAYQVDTTQHSVSQVLARLGQQLAIHDMTAESRPVEEIIAALYREQRV